MGTLSLSRRHHRARALCDLSRADRALDHWSSWEESRTGRRVEYSGANFPPALRIEMPVFTGIVLPPQWLAERVGYHRTMYGDLAMSHAGLNPPGSSFHYTPPPTIAAAEHLAVALPFWLAIVIAIGE